MNTLPSPTKSLHFLNPATIYHIHELRCIRPYLDFKTASTIATSVVHSKFDYSLYHNLPNYQLNRLQQIQNSLARAVVKAPKSSHIPPILKSLHWLKVNERIEYKLLSLTYKVLATSQPSYLNNLISVQHPRSTRSSSVVTFSRPSTISSLKITDRSFRYASPRLNSLIHSVSLASHVSTYLLIHLSAYLYYYHHSHQPSLFHFFTPGSKLTFSINPSHLRLLLPTGLPSWQRDWTWPIMIIVLFLVSHFNFLFVLCGGLSWLPVSFSLHVKYTLSYRIVPINRHVYKCWEFHINCANKSPWEEN